MGLPYGLRTASKAVEFFVTTRMEAIRAFHGILSGEWAKTFKSKTAAYEAACELGRNTLVDLGAGFFWERPENPHESLEARARRHRDRLNDPTTPMCPEAARYYPYHVKNFEKSVKHFKQRMP